MASLIARYSPGVRWASEVAAVSFQKFILVLLLYVVVFGQNSCCLNSAESTITASGSGSGSSIVNLKFFISFFERCNFYDS
jgi:hypothetical protein